MDGNKYNSHREVNDNLQIKDNKEDKIEIDSNQFPIVSERFTKLLEDFFSELTEINRISVIGPFISLIKDPQININNIREYGNLLLNYQLSFNKYMNNIMSSYFRAVEKVSNLIPGTTPEEGRKLIINTFEDVYSSMFESAEFSKNYNKLINDIIDLNKSFEKFCDHPYTYLNKQSLSKEEKDLLFNNLYEIKKLSLEIKNKLNEKKYE